MAPLKTEQFFYTVFRCLERGIFIFNLTSSFFLSLDSGHIPLFLLTGVAATRLQNKKFYPMVCSTAAKSSMRLIRACYTPTSLQYLCCAQLRQTLPRCPDVVTALDLPPGLRTLLQNRLGWVFTLSSSSLDSSEDETYFSDSCQQDEQTSVPSSPVSTMSACASLSPDPFLDTPLYDCPCAPLHQTHPAACHCPPTPPSSDYDSCCSEPEDYQCKRCRWT